MTLRLSSGRRFAVAAAVIVAALAASTVAWSAIPAADGTITGCLKDDGSLRIVNSAADCKKGERAITWNVKGRDGATGATGATGPAGPEGPKGDRGTPGSGSGLSSFDELNGLPCNLGKANEGVIQITQKPNETGLSFDCIPGNRWTLTVQVVGHGGHVDGLTTPGCDATCTQTYEGGTTVSLHAVAEVVGSTRYAPLPRLVG